MSIADQLTRVKADLDAVYAAGKAAGGGSGNRREYSGTIDEEVVGTSAYATLVEDDFLGTIRNLDTLFVRVECDVEPTAHTIVKNWASNVNGEVFPVAQTQLVYRYGSNGSRSLATLDKALDEDYVSGVGALHITESGKLLLYSGSPNYKIVPCNFKAIVEW